jgi:phenylpropionate dioxygenase-like ring-hydroxylating dioxygenase large terminal subunit
MNTLIPTRSYYDPAVYAAEQKELFARVWQFVGFTHDLAAHQDFVVREIGGTSVVVQNFKGTLRAFTNVCSHRFNRIQTKCRGNGGLQCSYHGWVYNEDGVPIGIPKKPRFDDLTPQRVQELALYRWRVEVCGRLVFVCRNAAATGLAEYLGAAFATVEAMTQASGPLIDENVMTIRANWKVLVENTLESYHVHFVHPNTFNRLNTADGVFEWQSPHSSWRTTLGEKVAARLEKPLSVFAERPFKTDGYFHQLVFPNLTIATTYGTSFSVQFFEPVDSDTTRFTSVVFQTSLAGNLADSAQATAAALNESVKTFNRSVFAEDKEICEQVQQGARMTDQSGILSDEELRVSDFQQQYWTRMEVGKK